MLVQAAFPYDDPQDGERRKQRHLQHHEARRAVFILQGRRALLEHLLEHGEGTADVVYPAVKLPTGVDPRCLGSVPGMLARTGIIRAAGFQKSTRPNRHASVLQVWELRDRLAAQEWLKTHPLPLEPQPDAPECGFSNPDVPPKEHETRQTPRQRDLSGFEFLTGDPEHA